MGVTDLPTIVNGNFSSSVEVEKERNSSAITNVVIDEDTTISKKIGVMPHKAKLDTPAPPITLVEGGEKKMDQVKNLIDVSESANALEIPYSVFISPKLKADIGKIPQRLKGSETPNSRLLRVLVDFALELQDQHLPTHQPLSCFEVKTLLGTKEGETYPRYTVRAREEGQTLPRSFVLYNATERVCK